MVSEGEHLEKSDLKLTALSYLIFINTKQPLMIFQLYKVIKWPTNTIVARNGLQKPSMAGRKSYSDDADTLLFGR